jgi:hypothetical protein
LADGSRVISERDIKARIKDRYHVTKYSSRITDPHQIDKTLKGLVKRGLLEYHGLMANPADNKRAPDPCYSVTDHTREILGNRDLSVWLLSLPRNRLLYQLDYLRKWAFEKIKLW